MNNPEDAVRGHAQGAVLASAVHRADDFREDPPKQYFRLAPGREVRLRYAYFITCTGVVKDDDRRSHRTALHLRPGHARRQRAGRPQGEGDDPLGLGRARRRRRGAAVRPPVHAENPSEEPEGQDFTANLNPNSLEVLTDCKLEPSLEGAAPGSRYQFERLGYFCVDKDSTPEQAGLQPHGCACATPGRRSRKSPSRSLRLKSGPLHADEADESIRR